MGIFTVVILTMLQSYLFFWDKLNKANYYLELSIREADKPLDDRLVNHLSSELISDGGQWDMVVNLLEVMPSCIIPRFTFTKVNDRTMV